VFSGDPAAPRKKGTSPTQSLADVCCGQMGGWLKMPLGTEVNLGPGDVVLDGIAGPLPPPLKGTQPPVFVHVYCVETAGWMKTPLGTEVDLGGPGHVLDGDPSPPRNGHSSPPSFQPMSIEATVAHLSYC